MAAATEMEIAIEDTDDEEDKLVSVPLNDYEEEEERPFCRALDDLYEEGKAPPFPMVVSEEDEDTVAALQKAKVDEPCQSICTEMMTMGYFDEEEMSRWSKNLNNNEGDNNTPRPPTKKWPLVVIDCDYSEQNISNSNSIGTTSNNTSISKKGKVRLPRKRRGRFIGCPTSNRYKPRNVDVVFADQDKYSTVYAIEVCTSTTSHVSDLYAWQGLARF